MSVEVFAKQADTLGESPLWSSAEQMLYWIDIGLKRLYRRSLEEDRRHWDLPSRPGFVERTSDDDLLLGFGGTLHRLSPRTGAIEPVLSVTLVHGARFNEGRVDGCGRLWFGSMQDNFAEDGCPVPVERAIGQVFRLDRSGVISVVEEQVGICNTFVWSPDQTRFYSADSLKGTICAYDFHAESGHVANKRVFFSAENLGVPDGSAMDVDGCIWNARWGAGKIVRIIPSGHLDREVELPVPQPTTCAFGGPQLDTLFVTSARLGLTPAQLAQYLLSGSVFAIDSVGQGLPTTGSTVLRSGS